VHIAHYLTIDCPKAVPQELLEIGGHLEVTLCANLFGPHGLKPAVHTSKPKMSKSGVFESAAVLEFASEKDAVFAQVVLEACCKFSKMSLWISNAEKVTVAAPVQRQQLNMTIVHTGSSARVGGASAINYLTEEGIHFFLPGQTVFVNNTVIVEDVTWLSGNEEWVWRAVALTPAGCIASPSSIAVGKVEHKMGTPELRQLVYLKHACHAALTTNFSPAGRIDLGVELCRSVMGLDCGALSAPALKKDSTNADAKVQEFVGGKASVLVVATPASSESSTPLDYKLNVVKVTAIFSARGPSSYHDSQGLSLKGVLAVASSKLLSCKPEQVLVRVERTGRAVGSDAVLREVLETEADATGVLRFEALRKGVLSTAKVAEPYVPSRPLERDTGLSRLALAASSALLGDAENDKEDDKWLVRTMLELLSVRGDGRMLPEEMLNGVRFQAKAPERITLQRLVDVATVWKPLEFNFSRQYFAALLTRRNAAGKSDSSFEFDARNGGESAVHPPPSWDGAALSPNASFVEPGRAERAAPGSAGKSKVGGKSKNKRSGAAGAAASPSPESLAWQFEAMNL
jgi:hypothetical protein